MKLNIVALTNPKYPYNLGAVLRACACWDIDKLVWSGTRVPHPNNWSESEFKDERIPRELRMKQYSNVELILSNRFKDIIQLFNVIPVAIELLENSENLFDFEHPDNAMYIFGPEDGSISSTILQHCHRFVSISTKYPMNLASTVNVVLSHRTCQIYKK